MFTANKLLLVMSFYCALLCSAQPVERHSERKLTSRHDTTLKALEKDEVIPDVIHGIPDWKPTIYPAASFSKTNESLVVHLGNPIYKPSAQSAPSLTFLPEPHKRDQYGHYHERYGSYGGHHRGEKDRKYTLCMTDPDAKSRETHANAEFLHWLITDITISEDDMKTDFTNANTLMPYMGPAPPEGTGKHRYVILLFRNGKEDPKPIKDNNRPHWGYPANGSERIGAMRYAADNGLTLVGANYFFTEY